MTVTVPGVSRTSVGPERRRDGHGVEKCQRIVSRLSGIGFWSSVRGDSPPLIGRLPAGRSLLRQDTLNLGHDPVSDPAIREHGATVPEVLQSREYGGDLVDDAARPEQEAARQRRVPTRHGWPPSL